MIYLFKNKSLLNKCIHKNHLIQNNSNIKHRFIYNSLQNNQFYLNGIKLNKFKNAYCFKKQIMYITTYTKDHNVQKKTFKENKSNYEDQSSKKILYYPENASFPYVSIFIVLGMVGISAFFKILIYNLKNCDDEKTILLQIDKIVNYLDKYFIIRSFEANQKSIGKSDIFNIKYLTSQFFTNENVLQSLVQISTFFLASCFLEKYYGSLKFLTLFLTGSVFSNIISFYFFKYIKKIESLNFIDFVLIHPSGSMAFICALCSFGFKNCAIWKNIPIHCSILIVPYLFSSFNGLISLYKVKKYNTANEAKRNDINNETLQLKNEEIMVQKKSEENTSNHNTGFNNTYDNVIKYKNKEKQLNSNFIQNSNNEALNILKNFLTVKACDSIIQKRKKENMFSNKRIQNLKKEASRNLDELNNKSQKMFFGLSSSFTDIFGILLASTTFLLLKILK